MNCEDARRTLWPEPGPRPATAEVLEAFTHYEGCGRCRRFFARERAFTARLRRLAEGREAPATLRGRITAALDAEVRRVARRRRSWQLAGGAALVGAAAALAVLIAGPGEVEFAPAVTAPLVAEAGAGLPGERSLATSDHRELATWFAGRVGYPVPVPLIDGATLLGGRATDLDGTPAAAVVYRFHDQTITYFALPPGATVGRDIADQDGIVVAPANGHHVALWTERGAARAVVGSMAPDAVLRFAEECRAKALGVS